MATNIDQISVSETINRLFGVIVRSRTFRYNHNMVVIIVVPLKR